ncbi:MAG: hypothetical protein F4X56_07685 [Gammaproteobacteria bacterium]|nr:hypothetical protein [Gammaproteobacteria bacterium]MYC25782.1 hypothetical protein [Gammaproteobacteria bacterium]
MTNQDRRNSGLHFQLVPYLIGTGLSVVLCVGALILFNPFHDEGVQTNSTADESGSDTPHHVAPVDETESRESDQGPRMSSNLASIFKLQTYFESSLALDDLLNNANVSMLIDLLDQSHDLQGVERLQSTQTQIFRKFATLDPIQALTYAESFPKSLYEHFVSLIYREWSAIDLDDALNFGEQHVPSLSWEGTSTVIEQIFRAAWELSDDAKLQLAERLQVNPYTSTFVLEKIENDKPLDNPIEAWKEVLSIENVGDDERYQLQQIGMAVIEKDGYSKFAELANSIQDRRTRTGLISRVLSDRLDTDEIGVVFEHALQLFHETARTVLFELAGRWCFKDPLAALNAMTNVPDDRLRKRLEERVIKYWVGGRPMEVLEQLDVLPVEYREIAVTEGIWSMSGRHPKETTKHLDKVSDPQTKLNVMWTMLQNWAYQDIEEAFTWFLDNPDLEVPLGHSRASLLAPLLNNVSPESARSLIELALKYPVDESGSGWESHVVGFLAYRDLANAKELLPKVRDGPGQLNAYVMIGQVVFNQDQSMNSVIELTEEIAEEDRVEFFGQFVPRLSPQVAYKQIDVLPTPEAQASAALGLLQRAEKSSNNPYNEEQIDHLESFLTDKERAVLELDSPSNR